ncbi:hypothetical protein C8R46DRAFT_1262748 [Mycena filopes]|nr:hypothetical protein C8R46DRAFT_1262748 [Mycena filopes]
MPLAQMETRRTPFDIQELVDHCIDFLRDSRPDLKACALVSRSWVYPAQHHLFRLLHLPSQPMGTRTAERSWGRFHDITQASPHVVRHIHGLRIIATYLSNTSLLNLCGLPFTRLSCVVFRIHEPISQQRAEALSLLFALPCLRRVTLDCIYGAAEPWLRVWECFSPSIKHLDIHCRGNAASEFPPPTDGRAPIILDSLRIRSLPSLPGWLRNTFSCVRVLSLDVMHIPWSEFAALSHTVEVLDVAITMSPETSLLFPKLSLLRILMPDFREARVPAFTRLVGLGGPDNDRMRLVLHAIYPATAYALIDAALATLPPRQVELQVTAPDYECAMASFSHVKPVRSDPVLDWFEALTHSERFWPPALERAGALTLAEVRSLSVW